MDLRAFLTEEGAVSSVLGVVLMVAVTIVLAAVVGTFVLGIGEQLTQDNPQVVFDHSFADDSMTILHGGGDEIERSNLEITIDGTEAYPNPGSEYNVTRDWPERVTAGDSVRIEEDGGTIDEGDDVIIIWSDGQQSAIISEEVVS